MPELNPYAPPVDDDAAPPSPPQSKKKKKSARAWREGDRAVVRVEDARLPKRCVVCNQPGDGDRIRRQLMWHPQWVYGMVFIGVLVYLLVAAFTRLSVTVEHSLCEAHKQRRRNGQLLLFGGIGGGVLLLVLGSATSTTPLIGLGSITIMGCAIAGALMARTLSAAKIDSQHAWLNVGHTFLESLPYRDE